MGKMLKELIAKNVPVKVCGTCKVRCGIHNGEPYFEGTHEAKMTELAQWVKEAGKVILENYGNFGKLKFKDPRSLLTKADLLSEKIIIETITKKFPDHNFLTEESGNINKGSEYTWIIDPIDGTTNFVAKIPEFAVSIALAKNNEILMGVVHNPYTNEMFFAEKGKGSCLNNKKLAVSKKNKLEQ